jgi:hypothetical protein
VVFPALRRLSATSAKAAAALAKGLEHDDERENELDRAGGRAEGGGDAAAAPPALRGGAPLEGGMGGLVARGESGDEEGGAGPAADAPRSPERAGEARHRCEDDHARESARFEELGRLLGDVKACARRGAREVRFPPAIYILCLLDPWIVCLTLGLNRCVLSFDWMRS